MKKTIVCIVMSFFALSIFAQQETLFNKSRAMGAFGGPIIEFGTIAGKYSVATGGGGGFIVDNFFIGGYGLGASDFESVFNNNDFVNVDIAHGGIWLGYNLRSNKVLHPYSTLKIGWGAVDIQIDDDDFPFDRWDSIFALTPEVGVELNVTKFFHIAASAGYRWVNGVNETNPNFSNEDFRNLNASLTFRFGWFGRWRDRGEGDGRRGLWRRGDNSDCD